MEPYFDHEQLEVYQLARQLNREIHVLVKAVPRGHANSKDNLTRAAKSITRNTAEGGGRWAVADKTHFYHIARASATECAASLDELVDFEVVPGAAIRQPRTTLARIVAMLISMIRSMESRAGRHMQE